MPAHHLAELCRERVEAGERVGPGDQPVGAGTVPGGGQFVVLMTQPDRAGSLGRTRRPPELPYGQPRRRVAPADDERSDRTGEVVPGRYGDPPPSLPATVADLRRARRCRRTSANHPPTLPDTRVRRTWGGGR